ncbi:hypothetical protein Tco_1388960 [Tanacetum coccineum]
MGLKSKGGDLKMGQVKDVEAYEEELLDYDDEYTLVKFCRLSLLLLLMWKKLSIRMRSSWFGMLVAKKSCDHCGGNTLMTQMDR